MPAPANLVHQQTADTGTGPYTLSNVNGKQAFETAQANGSTIWGTGGTNVFDVFMSNQGAAEWMYAKGHIDASTHKLVIDTIIEGSNGTSAVSFSAGTKDIMNDIPAAKQVTVDMIREVLSAGLTLYVATTGSDSNSGLSSGAAFKTWQKAYDTVCNTLDLNGYKVVVNIADGTYTDKLVVNKNIVGGSDYDCLKFVGNNTTPANVILSTTSAHAIALTDSSIGATRPFSQIALEGCELRTTTAGDCVLNAGGSFYWKNVRFGTSAGAHVNTIHQGWSYAYGDYAVVGNCANGHLAAASGGIAVTHLNTVTFSNSPSIGWFVTGTAYAQFYTSGMTFVNGGTVTGSKFLLTNGAFCYTGGAGVDFHPGSSGGTCLAGGQYDQTSDSKNLISKTSDTSRASTTTLANDPHLQFTMEANHTYDVKLVIKFDAPATPGFKWGLVGPSSPSWVRCDKWWRAPNATSITTEVSDVGASYPTNKTISGNASTSGYLEIEARISNGANAGTFAFQWAQNTSNASNTSVGITSYLEYILVV